MSALSAGSSRPPLSAPTAPPVVAVVVAHDPGPWFEESLAALVAQDYPNLSVLVVDSASANDVTPRVAAVAPRAHVVRTAENLGFAAAVNRALGMVEGATHALVCHDDAAPEPDALRQLVQESFRSNAGVVAPKLVAWEDPGRLLAFGMGMAAGGVATDRVERGELDQEQHDAARDVFAAPGGAFLIRWDLFEKLRGFDAGMQQYGEDLDLSWRAQLAGARVVVAPAARVRHLEAARSGLRPVAHLDGTGGPPRSEEAARLALVRRHELRATLKNCGALSLLPTLAWIAFSSAGEAAIGFAMGRPDMARGVLHAWAWNARHLGDLRSARRSAQAARRAHDREVHRRQGGVRARVAGLQRPWREVLPAYEALEGASPAGAQAAGLWRPGLATAAWVAVVLVMVVGARQLIGSAFPGVAQLVAWPSWRTFGSMFLSGWGTAAASPAPLAYGLLALSGALFLGHVALLQHVLVLGTLPAGALGAWQLAARAGSRRARVAGMVVYAGLPLPYGALGRGDWEVMVAYAAAPWVLHALCASVGAPAGDADHPPQGVPLYGAGALARRTLALGLLVAVVGAVVPGEVLLVGLTGAGLMLGSLAAGEARHAWRALGVAGGAIAVAVVLSLPWALSFFHDGARLTAFAGGAQPGGQGIGALLALGTGPMGGAPLTWGFAAAGLATLLYARGWRLRWAARCWGVVVASVAFAWAAGHGWLGGAMPSTAVLVAPAGAGLCLAVALGTAAFERDLPGYHLGWRHAVSVAGGAGACLGLLVVLGAAAGGRFGLPSGGYAQELSWMSPRAARGAPFRSLWLGDPRYLPLASSPLSSRLSFALSDGGFPSGASLWARRPPDPGGGIGRSVLLAVSGRTTSLGATLAASSVRYVVITRDLAPGFAAGGPSPGRPVAAKLVSALAAQDDLRRLQGDPSLVVFEDTAWPPPDGPGSHPASGALGSHRASGALGERAAVSLEGALWVLSIWVLARTRRRRSGSAAGA